MGLVCLDSHILIWGIKEQANVGQEQMIQRSKAFLNQLEKTSTKVLVPAVILAELLIPVPRELHIMVNNLLHKSFIIAPFDAIAAAHYANIWQSKKDKGLFEELQRDGRTKNELRIDNMIVSTAVARGAECIYSHDDAVTKFADGFIQVKQVPPLPEVQEKLL